MYKQDNLKISCFWSNARQMLNEITSSNKQIRKDCIWDILQFLSIKFMNWI
jgi:hypothetical protein